MSDPHAPTAGSFASRAASWLVRRRVALFAAAILLAAMSVERSRGLEFVRSIDSMFDRTDSALAPYRRLQRAFGSSEVVLAAYDAPDLLTTEGIDTLGAVTARLAAVPGVASATSLSETPLGAAVIDVDTNQIGRAHV